MNDQNTPTGLQRDPDEWKTGDEPMTEAQRSYLETLARESGEAVDENLTKAEASKKIDELRQKPPRLTEPPQPDTPSEPITPISDPIAPVSEPSAPVVGSNPD